MKKAKIFFWVTTGIIVLFEGVLPALTANSELARSGITHLGYPLYFGTMLVVFKVLGAIALIVPRVPKMVKEWAYAGFAIDFVAAAVSTLAVDGLTIGVLLPVIFIGLLIVSYTSKRTIEKETLMHTPEQR